jgi:hypothetical protein
MVRNEGYVWLDLCVSLSFLDIEIVICVHSFGLILEIKTNDGKLKQVALVCSVVL